MVQQFFGNLIYIERTGSHQDLKASTIKCFFLLFFLLKHFVLFFFHYRFRWSTTFVRHCLLVIAFFASAAASKRTRISWFLDVVLGKRSDAGVTQRSISDVSLPAIEGRTWGGWGGFLGREISFAIIIFFLNWIWLENMHIENQFINIWNLKPITA